MTPLFDVAAPPVNRATGEDLREQVHRHLRTHPMLTAYEIARALHLDCPRGTGQNKVRRQLLLMEGDGETERVPGTRTAGDSRPAVRWVAT